MRTDAVKILTPGSEWNYCSRCGMPLALRRHKTEDREIPWCGSCGEWRFPQFNTAVSMLVMNEAKDQILLIRQYGQPFYILCAGYVNQGEDAEDAAVREVREELGLTALEPRFNRSHYFPPSNTLMLNFTVPVRETEAHPNWEVDSWRWFSLPEARENIKPGSLAAAFLLGYLDGEYHFPR